MSNIPESEIVPIVASLQSVLQVSSRSPAGATLLPGSYPATLTDLYGNTWGFSNSPTPGVLRNGIADGGAGAVLIQMDVVGDAWVEGAPGVWYLYGFAGPYVQQSSGPNVGTAPLSQARVLVASLQAIVTQLGAALVQPAPPPGLQADIVALGKLTVPMGANLSGAEFTSNHIPGVLGTDYFFDTVTAPYLIGLGARKIRIPFRLERMIPGWPSSLALDPAHVSWLTGMITAYPGVTFVLDAHNFGLFVTGGAAFGIGDSGGPTTAQFGAMWLAIAEIFGQYSNVEFDLMNEPGQQTVAQIIAMDNAAIAAIRSGGFTNRIWIEGASSTAGSNWTTTSGNVTMLGQIVDSANNFGFMIHQYGDATGENTAPVTIPTSVVTNLTLVTAWAHTNSVQLMLGEFGTDSGVIGLQCIADTMTFLCQNQDVWQGGVTWWNAGMEVGSYISALTTGNPPTANPQLTALEQFW
jgi:endoglucanase